MKRKKPGTLAIIIDGDRLLLHLRRDHKKWGLPGGSVDFGESFETAVRREVHEETGLEVEVVRVRGVYSNPKKYIFSYPDGNRVHGFMVGFECRVVGGQIIRSSDESLDVRWFSLSDLPVDILSNHVDIISQICAGIDMCID